MKLHWFRTFLTAGAATLTMAAVALAQGPPDFGPGGFGGGGRGGRGGPGGMGPGQQEIKLLQQYDKDGDGRLNAEERKAARESAASRSSGRRGGRGGFGGGAQQGGTPGAKLTPADVKSYSSEPFYDMQTLRTLFLQFEEADWEKELADFHNTDVEVAAKLTVDGKTYPDVGVHFRGNTSYSSVPEGLKRSLGISIDFANPDQRLYGYRTLNLLNSMSDPTFLRVVLYLQVMRDYIPALKANYARVVINGESWGIYVNEQQFNTDFTKEFFGSTKGVRWKVPVSMGGGPLAYLGEDPASYKRVFEIKSKDDPKSWTDLIRLCKVLNQTPPEQLEKALEPLLDIDGALKYLAVDVALINNDGYYSRGSDFNLYEDEKGRFHVVPNDVNETIRPSEGGRGGPFGGGGGGGGARLDPFTGSNDQNKPLLSRLLAVPSLRARFLGYVRDVSEKWLTWDKIGPLATQYQALIAADVKADTRKLDTFEAFTSGVAGESAAAQEFSGFRGRGGGMNAAPEMSLKSLLDQRRAYLLEYTAPKAPALP